MAKRSGTALDLSPRDCSSDKRRLVSQLWSPSDWHHKGVRLTATQTQADGPLQSDDNESVATDMDTDTLEVSSVEPKYIVERLVAVQASEPRAAGTSTQINFKRFKQKSDADMPAVVRTVLAHAHPAILAEEQEALMREEEEDAHRREVEATEWAKPLIPSTQRRGARRAAPSRALKRAYGDEAEDLVAGLTASLRPPPAHTHPHESRRVRGRTPAAAAAHTEAPSAGGAAATQTTQDEYTLSQSQREVVAAAAVKPSTAPKPRAPGRRRGQQSQPLCIVE